MATNTYVALDTKTVASAVAYVEFTNIPTTYTDLVIVARGNTDAATTTKLNVGNGSIDTGSNYSWTVLSGTGSAANSYRESSVTFTQNERYANWDTTSNANTILQLQNYANTTTYKTWLTRGNNASAGVDAIVGMWRSTSAINTVRISCTNGGRTFAVGTTFTIYGISNAGQSSAKAVGGIVTSDATYWYHSFPMSGNFVPNQSITADILCVAGGGGGGFDNAGGGGAGGFLTYTSQSLTASTYQVLIGAGGARGTTGSGSNGGNSQFGALTASVGGGFGSGYQTTAGGSGGSGGGGGGISGTPQAGGSGTSGQGYAGGTGTTGGGASAAGGGGGASGVGGAGTNGGAGGAGGNGATNAISGGSTTGYGQLVSGSYYFAGGGGGAQKNTPTAAAGGSGGGGNGGTTALVGIDGTVSTGSGGGGGTNGLIGGNGGSGIVIVRYAK